IAEKVLPDSVRGKEVAAQLAQLHCRLRSDLQAKNIPLQPVSQHLQTLAGALSEEDLKVDRIPELFARHYRLYLLAAGTTAQVLSAVTLRVTRQNSCDKALCQWLNQTVRSLPCPWLVKRGKTTFINPNTYEVTVKEHLNNDEAKAEIIKQLAETRWSDSGMPKELSKSTGPLESALYRLWQQCWFTRCYGDTGVRAEQVFPLNTVQTMTLAMKTNQPYLAEAARVMEAMDFETGINWPACWQELLDVLKQPVASYCQKAPKVSTQLTDAMDTQAQLPQSVKKKQHSRTNYEQLPTQHLSLKKVFQTPAHDPRMTRIYVYDIAVTTDGGLRIIRLGNGEHGGLEAVLPGTLSASDPIPLARNHYYAQTSLTLEGKQWLFLPSMT
ncbi:hypothetical protein, partial [Sansalvadorimonas verongulae]|uniref:hypothetical protein n=1 Tax=Sansalvadorimonas verongulae TaxID=2172824 RepID=UPI0018AD2B6A